jgi:hypothetical protein
VNRDEFSRCVALIRAYWPHGTATWTAAAIEAWESLLLDLDAAAAAAAIQVLAAEGREWPPPPGVVRQRASELVSPIPTGGEAWAEVCGQVRRVGSLRGMSSWPSGEPIEPVWSHPLIGEVADHCGWDALCASTNEMADRAHFLRLWEQASARERTGQALPPAARAALAARGIQLPHLTLKEIPA